ncbi:MAG TPA: potassium-transporting ATPase subunit KdpB [Candidatus Dormibacteraeota bacterium]|jgi:K+-transporting ATPase ATPase B chain|nr:potassium-transporting ATPase subunit KdpB [Candidatus Dormibacteraeota bacterium]
MTEQPVQFSSHPGAAPSGAPLLPHLRQGRRSSLLDPAILVPAVWASFKKLDPRWQARNPVMFVVEVGSAITTYIFIRGFFVGAPAFAGPNSQLFVGQISLWLWFTVLFANFAEAVAEGRGKAQAAALRRTRSETIARRQLEGGGEDAVPATDLRRGDRVVCEANDVIPGDGTVVEGIASVDESAITGESAPVIREAGGDRDAVTGGTRVLSDRVVIEIQANPGETFLDRMIGLVESASRRKTPNEIALNILLAALTIIFLIATVTLQPFAIYAGTSVSVTVLISLLVCLIPTTIGALLSAIGIAGIDRLLQRNVVALSGRAVEAAGDVDTLLLDKTGTITFGNRQAAEFVPAGGVQMEELVRAAALASLADETPEGRSIVTLAGRFGGPATQPIDMTFVPFSANTRMSGVDYKGTSIRKGASDSVAVWCTGAKGQLPAEVRESVELIARAGGTPLVVADSARVLGTIHLKDIVKPHIAERFAQLRRMGLRTVMITGDNPLTAAAIAKEAGVDDFLAQATPEDKLDLIKSEQDSGRMVAMTGDGTNDAPALAQADVAVAMNSGTQAAKEAGNLIDLDSDPTKLIEIVEAGKQMLITRGALTTFSIANDVAKYFAIIPAIFLGFATTSSLGALNIMRLHSSSSAVLSAVIFNAVIIVILIPLALRGVKYRAIGAAALLSRNLLIYGVGGIIAPFAGIKLIDLALTGLHLA